MSIRIIYDATHVLQEGTNPPVGITRVEHYVAEYLITQTANAVHFVHFDPATNRYVEATPAEDLLIRRYLLHRYQADDHEPIAADPPKPPPLDAGHFAVNLSNMFETRLAIPANWPAILRLPLGVIRGAAYRCIRAMHATLRIIARADAAVRGRDSGENEIEQRSEFEWQESDALIALSNLWDYMDYEYLFTLKTRFGIKIITIVYDVIALIYPYSTYASTDLYHRHWVEIAHACTNIVAISQETARTYQKYILDPNHLKAQVSVATLPNFLKDRAGDIGVQPIAELVDKKFVVYCSTIEARKNHQTLIHVWERLIEDLDLDSVPILIFVGRWGWGFETVQRMYERCWRLRPKLQIRERVTDSELIWLYKNAIFTAFPSLAEGFGLAAAESLSFGTPVITSSCAALSEATEGLMPGIDPLDVPEWTRVIENLLLDEGAIATLRQRATQFRGADYAAFARTVLCLALSEGRSEHSCAG